MDQKFGISSSYRLIFKCSLGLLVLSTPVIFERIISTFEIPLNKPTKLTWILRSIINAYNCIKFSVLPSSVTKENGGVISELTIHPLKSASGISLQECEVDEFGLKYDRIYMLSVWNGKKHKYEAITQRQHPRLCLVNLRIEGGNVLIVKYPKRGTNDQYDDENQFKLPLEVTDSFISMMKSGKSGNKNKNFNSKQAYYEDDEPVELWDVDFEAIVFDNLLPLKFIEEMELPPSTKLLYSIKGKELITNAPSRKILPETRFTKFQDYFPSLIMTEEDMQDINIRLAVDFKQKYDSENYNNQISITSANFRPNIVIKGTKKPYDTDDWSQIKIINKHDENDQHRWYITSKCPRCSIPNINQELGTFYNKPRISQLLAGYRRIDPGGIYFSFLGACAVQLDYGYIMKVGDKVEIMSRRLNHYKNLE